VVHRTVVVPLGDAHCVGLRTARMDREVRVVGSLGLQADVSGSDIGDESDSEDRTAEYVWMEHDVGGQIAGRELLHSHQKIAPGREQLTGWLTTNDSLV